MNQHFNLAKILVKILTNYMNVYILRLWRWL